MDYPHECTNRHTSRFSPVLTSSLPDTQLAVLLYAVLFAIPLDLGYGLDPSYISAASANA